MAARHVVDSVVLVINPAAGGGSAGNRGDEFASLLRSVGTASVRSLVPQDVAATERVLRELAAEGVSRVVLAGGDGMVHAAVNAFANTPTVLGILPVGSGNDFARGVGLLANNLPAAAIAAVGPPTSVDLILASPLGDGPGGRPPSYAASIVTTGFSAIVNERGNRLRLGRARGIRYNVATMLELPRLGTHNLRLVLHALDASLPAETVTLDATLVAIANTRYFGAGMAICPEASPTDGMLDITVVTKVGPGEMLRTFRRVYAGTHITHPAVRTFRASSVTLDSTEPMAIRADGESFGSTPMGISAAPAALQLALPRWAATV